MKKSLFIVTLILSFFLSYSFAWNITSSIYMLSEEWEYVWWWQEYDFDTEYGDEITIKYTSYDESIQFKVDSDQIWNPYNFGFEAQNGKIQEGIYENATRLPFNDDEHGLSVYGNGRGCNKLIGDFNVRHIDRDWEEVVSSLIEFVQLCDNSDKLLYWIIAYNLDAKWVQAALVELEDEYSSAQEEQDNNDYVDPDSFKLAIDNTSPQKGDKLDLIIKAVDSDGNIENEYIGDVFIEVVWLNSNYYSVPEDWLYWFIESDNGKKSFYNKLQINKAWTYIIRVSDIVDESIYGEIVVKVWDDTDNEWNPDLLEKVIEQYIEKVKTTTTKFLPEYSQYCDISIDNAFIFDCLETQESIDALKDIEESVYKAQKLRTMLEGHFGISSDVEYVSNLLADEINASTIKKDLETQLDRTNDINYRITSIAKLMKNWTKDQKNLVRALQWTIQINIDALESALDNL